MRKWLSLGLVAALTVGTLALAGCDGGEETSGGTEGGGEEELTGSLQIEGSDTLVNMAQVWAERFQEENPGVVIAVKGGGSGNGIAALINGTVDFANASREIKEEEVTEAEGAGVEPVEHAVALDGISVIVHPDNPVTDLTTEQLGRIYRGEITDWSEVGGPDKGIVLTGRDTSSGTYEFFKEAVVAVDDENADYSQTMRNLGSNQAIVSEVSGNDAAIGYVGIGYAQEAGDSIKVLMVDGTEATVDNVASGTYTLSRKLYMYSNGEPSDTGAAYLEWILGPEGQAVVGDEGFVPVR